MLAALFLFGFALFLFPGQSPQAQPPAPSYQKPSELLRKDMIQRLENELSQKTPSHRQIIKQARTALEGYYSQFTEERRIQYERRNEARGRRVFGKNTIRLFSQAQRRRFVRPYFLRESPYLFRLHLVLARAYAALDDIQASVAQYAMAFRYATIEPQTLEEEASRQSLLEGPLDRSQESRVVPTKENATEPSESQKEERYQWMLKSFADQDRIAQEDDSRIQAEARRFRSELKSYFDLKQRYIQADSEVALAQARRARGQRTSPIEELRAQRDRLSREWEETEQNLRDIREGAYKRYHQRRRKLQGNAAYRMAVQVRRLEIENKAALDRSNRRLYLRGSGDQNFYEKKNTDTDHSGFRALLELAHKIDPFHLDHIRLLSDQNREVRDTNKAIFFTRLYIRLAQNKEKVPQDLGHYALRLAGLYMDQRNYIQAASSYEFALKLNYPPNQRPEALQGLAELHYKKTGNFSRAAELYQEYLRSIQGLSVKEGDLKKSFQRYKIYEALASIARRQQEGQTEEKYLQEAQREFTVIEKEKEELQKEITALDARALKLKRQLVTQRNADLEREYYFIKRKQIAEKKKLSFIRSRLDSLNLPRLLERLAWRAQSRRSWREAQEFYRQILIRGSGPHIQRARGNLRRIRLSLKDGIPRRALIAPDFER